MLALMHLIDLIAWLIYLLVLARVIISWLPLVNVRVPTYHPLVIFIKQVTEPLLRPFRRLLPPSKTSGLDVSPLFLLFAVSLVQQFLRHLLLRL
jgi:YggT family protein